MTDKLVKKALCTPNNMYLFSNEWFFSLFLKKKKQLAFAYFFFVYQIPYLGKEIWPRWHGLINIKLLKHLHTRVL